MSNYKNDVVPVIAEALAMIADGWCYYECKCEDLSDFKRFAHYSCGYHFDESPNFAYYAALACGNVDGVSTGDVFADLRAALARLHHLVYEFMSDWTPRDAEAEITVLEAIAECERYGLEAA